jgi:hypothetical protein
VTAVPVTAGDVPASGGLGNPPETVFRQDGATCRDAASDQKAKLSSPPLSASTTTRVPTGVRRKRSITSWLIMRMQPEETRVPIVSGSFVPWIR